MVFIYIQFFKLVFSAGSLFCKFQKYWDGRTTIYIKISGGGPTRRFAKVLSTAATKVLLNPSL